MLPIGVVQFSCFRCKKKKKGQTFHTFVTPCIFNSSNNVFDINMTGWILICQGRTLVTACTPDLCRPLPLYTKYPIECIYFKCVTQYIIYKFQFVTPPPTHHPKQSVYCGAVSPNWVLCCY